MILSVALGAPFMGIALLLVVVGVASIVGAVVPRFPFQAEVMACTTRLLVWVAGRRLGKSDTVALLVALSAAGVQLVAGVPVAYDPRLGEDWICVSINESTTSAMLDTVERHLRALEMVLARPLIAGRAYLSIRLTNGRTVLGVASGAPAGARGRGANIWLDEANDVPRLPAVQQAVFAVASPSPSRPKGYRIIVTGTAGWDGSPWFDLAHDPAWSRFTTALDVALAQGLPGSLEQARASMPSQAAFEQEYLCRWSSASERYVHESLYDACVPAVAPPIPPDAMRFAGIDLGRTEDPSAVVELVRLPDGRLLVTHAEARRGVSWLEQEAWLGGIIDRVTRAAIDSTSIGSMFSERAVMRWGARVVPYHFSSSVRDALLSGLLVAFERRALVLPPDPTLRRDVLALRREGVTTTGAPRIVAPRGPGGHCDLAIALALAVTAAGGALRDYGDAASSLGPFRWLDPPSPTGLLTARLQSRGLVASLKNRW